MVIPTGFEPVAYSLGNCRSILLSYGTISSEYQKSRADCTQLLRLPSFFAVVVFCVGQSLLSPRAAATPLPCDAEGAVETTIAGHDADGIFSLPEGYRLRLANIIWPDHLETGRRGELSTRLSEALKDQNVSWKPVAGPDRWGITPVNLFIREKNGALAPFWLQAGLVEAGLVATWPEPLHAACWTRLAAHEAIAIKARRGYWAPRAQSARHRAIAANPEAHAGQRLAALWQVKSVRPWRSMHFVNFMPSFRGGPSIGLTRRQMVNFGEAKKTDPGKDPLLWPGKWIVARFIIGSRGLSRLRVESIGHIGLVE